MGTSLVFPDTLLADFNKYAPFPASLGILDSIPKVVLISQRVQAFGLYEKGELIRWGLSKLRKAVYSHTQWLTLRKL
ncbi:hypothetical protein LZ575_06620 [Antarcticibacterium sp. 1MA-6-2]|uniref:hypothetical protein n=1 Tax=Antarcticibacterium sp. 1MA-6-2 TaxID=2908210 RepID=UPI001F1E6C8B|nr:hypothetical protein [Antarcticibacterium sp. 1MA-6-2]UJH92230.1 hypothetical protein LZ575_06620 [Antarcticibacterium sp. 1MA-6-2]